AMGVKDMEYNELSEKIYEMAIQCGFENCGIIPLSEVDGYKQRLNERREKIPQSVQFYKKMEKFTCLEKRYPWGKSIVVCTSWLGKYQYPKSLQGKYAKAFMLSGDTVPDSEEHKNKKRFEAWMRDQKIYFEGGETNAPLRDVPLRHAAVAAGLGIFRKNNFFYTEKGSYYALEGYIIDKTCVHKHVNNIKSCSDTCLLCQQACKTQALSSPYTMNPLACVSFWTTFGKGRIPKSLDEGQFEDWVCGCDSCQDACPYNRRDWSVGEKFPGLEELTELLRPQNIVKASDAVLCEKVIPKTERHIPPDQVETLRITAVRVLRQSRKT
ncbi:epoxyqueuosine reductase, partial [Megasphaera cerevisiae]